MQPPRSPSAPLAASHDLLTILAEIDVQRPALATSTPERQRLAFTAWIARARAAEAVLGGTWADRRVGEIAEILHHLSRLWWPGRIAALDPRSTPAQAWPGVSLTNWREVESWCRRHVPHAESWADDAAREPPPHDAADLFAAVCDLLRMLGGPLGEPAAIDRSPAALASARRQLPRLARVAAELRWLRGTAPAESWGYAIGRLRGLARGLKDDGAPLAGLLAPALVPLKGWAAHLGRVPARERVLGAIPTAECADAELVAWLVRGFDVLDTPAMAERCAHLQARLAALRPKFEDRRHRRRLEQLLHRFKIRTSKGVRKPVAHPAPENTRSPADDPRLAELRALLQGCHALLVTNRSAPEIEKLLADRLGLVCEAVASVGKARRRQALLRRIHSGSYDIVLVAQGFSNHADTEQFSAACRQAGICFCAVDKGRIARVITALWDARHHPRLIGRVAARGSAA